MGWTHKSICQINSSHKWWHNCSNNWSYFFPSVHGNEFSNLIGSFSCSDFPISAHGHSNAQVSFFPFVCKSFKVQELFQNSFVLDKKVEKQKLSFQSNFFIAMLKWRYSSLHRQLVYCIYKVRRVCAGGTERMKKLFWESEEKINKLFAGLGAVCTVKMLREIAGRGQRFSIPRKESCHQSLHIARNITRQITRHIVHQITLYITSQINLQRTRQITRNITRQIPCQINRHEFWHLSSRQWKPKHNDEICSVKTK